MAKKRWSHLRAQLSYLHQDLRKLFESLTWVKFKAESQLARA